MARLPSLRGRPLLLRTARTVLSSAAAAATAAAAAAFASPVLQAQETVGFSLHTNATFSRGRDRGSDEMVMGMIGGPGSEVGTVILGADIFQPVARLDSFDVRVGRAKMAGTDLLVKVVGEILLSAPMQAHLRTYDCSNAGGPGGYCVALGDSAASEIVHHTRTSLPPGSSAALLRTSDALQGELRECGLALALHTTVTAPHLPVLVIRTGTHREFVFFVHGTGCHRLRAIAPLMIPLRLAYPHVFAPFMAGPMAGFDSAPGQGESQPLPQVPSLTITPLTALPSEDVPVPELQGLLAEMSGLLQNLNEQVAAIDDGVHSVQSLLYEAQAADVALGEEISALQKVQEAQLAVTLTLVERLLAQQGLKSLASSAVSEQAAAIAHVNIAVTARRRKVEKDQDGLVEQLKILVDRGSSWMRRHWWRSCVRPATSLLPTRATLAR